MRRILVAVDTTPNAVLVVARALAIARSTGAKVRLVHVVSPPVVVPPPPGVVAVVPPRSAQELVANADATLARLFRPVPRELRDGAVVELGSAPECVCALARAYGADLVVIGAHEHGLVRRMLGTTAARIVNNLDRPVLVVRPVPSEQRGAAPHPGSREATSARTRRTG